MSNEPNTVTAFNARQNGRNHSNKKELTNVFSLVAYRDGALVELIDCRCWMGRSSQASVVYASIWIHAPARGTVGGIYAAGHGKAGGYGYHKPSAAIQDAITDAGITLKRDIDGVGESAIRGALEAIARKLGYRKTLIVEH